MTKINLIFSAIFVALTFPAFSQQGLPANFQKLLDKNLTNNVHASKAAVQNRGNETCLPDSSVTFAFSPPSDSTVESKSLFTYNSNGDVLTVDEYSANDMGEVLLSRTETNTYDAQGRKTVFEVYEANTSTGIMEFSSREQTFYRGTTNLIDSLIEFSLDETTNMITPTKKDVYTYDAANTLLSSVSYFWDDLAAVPGWVLSTKNEFNYDAQGKITSVDDFNYDGFGWVAVANSVYTYYPNDSLKTITTTDLVTNQPTDQVEVIYNQAENITTTNLSSWDTDAMGWINVGYVKQDLDAQNRLDVEEVFISFGFFAFGQRIDQNYPANGDCPSFSNNYFSADGVEWTFIGRSFNYYNNSSSTESLENGAQFWSFTPNPASDAILVNTPSESMIKLVDMTGKTVTSIQTKQAQTRINLTNLPEGHYMLSVQNGGRISAKLVQVK